jgi:uncharacterized protein (TIGR03437 family)
VTSASPVRLAPNGDIILAEDVLQRRPRVYQETPAGRRSVSGRYVIESGNRVRFRIGHYDRTLPLIIDPVISYSTLFGGSGNDAGGGIAVDSSGYAYIAGATDSSDLPAGVAGTRYAGIAPPDIFVAKITPDGTNLVYCAYIGGEGDDEARAIAVDSAGNAYVTGFTTSFGFPVTGGVLQATFAQGKQDAFVLKLAAGGNSLAYATYLGGGGGEEGRAIAIDQSGDAFVTGVTNSLNFPLTTGAYQRRFLGGGYDGFVAMIGPTGRALGYSTLLGSSGDDEPAGIAVDSQGNAYVTGYTTGSDFPTTSGAYQASLPNTTSSPFVTKLNPSGGTLVYSTFLGGGVADQGKAITLDSGGEAYIAGSTNSPDFPATDGAYKASLSGSSDAFVAKLNAAGNDLAFATYLGGSGADGATAIDLDLLGNIYIAGDTSSPDLPATPSLQAAPGGGRDGFVAKLDATGGKLIFASYLGGSQDEHVAGIAVDPVSNAYVLGTTLSPDFHTTPGALRANVAAEDSFVVKVQDVLLPLLQADHSSLTFTYDVIAPAPGPQAIQISSNSDAISFSATTTGGSWLVVTPATGTTPGPLSVSINPANLAAATYKGTVVVTSLTAANSPLTIPVTFTLTRGGGSPGGGPAVQPSTIIAGSTDTTVIVSGSNFVRGATVLVNGTPVATTYLSSWALSAVIPASYLASPGTLTLTVKNAGPLATAGTYTVTVILPTPLVTSVVNAASSLPGPVAGGEVVVIRGSLIGPVGGLAPNNVTSYGTNLGGSQVFFGKVAAPLLFTSDGEITAVVPYELTGGTTQLTVQYNGGTSAPLALAVAPAAPGLFTWDGSGVGEAAAMNADGNTNGIYNPALAGSLVTFTATGGGATSPASVDGSFNSAVAPPSLLLPVTMQIGNESATIVSVVPAPGVVSGILQIQASVPSDLSGTVPVMLWIGGIPAQSGVTLEVWQPVLPPVDAMRHPALPAAVRGPRQ